eukprot:1191932-Prorocentrum_minimum.AAC.4
MSTAAAALGCFTHCLEVLPYLLFPKSSAQSYYAESAMAIGETPSQYTVHCRLYRQGCKELSHQRGLNPSIVDQTIEGPDIATCRECNLIMLMATKKSKERQQPASSTYQGSEF